jgi:hypothetical protein
MPHGCITCFVVLDNHHWSVNVKIRCSPVTLVGSRDSFFSRDITAEDTEVIYRKSSSQSRFIIAAPTLHLVAAIVQYLFGNICSGHWSAPAAFQSPSTKSERISKSYRQAVSSRLEPLTGRGIDFDVPLRN